MLYEREALRYHQEPRPGKIEVIPSKPCLSQSDLSLAYTPGVAVPCLKIRENPELSFEYTIPVFHDDQHGTAIISVFPTNSWSDWEAPRRSALINIGCRTKGRPRSRKFFTI